MKDNLNIEELFKEKFNSFEGEVSPDAWTNIQQGMNVAGAAAAKTGVSLFVKTAIISGGIIAATVAGVYFFSDSNPIENNEGSVITMDDSNIAEISNDSETLPVDIIRPADDNDPVIEERRTEIENEIQNGLETVDSHVETVDQGSQTNDLNVGNADSQESDKVEQDDSNTGDVSSDAGTESNPNQDVNSITDLVDDSNQEDEFTTEKEDFPTGRMTFEAGDKYAPSTYSFASNAQNYTAVKWEFGDGSVGEGESVDHTFEKPGEYAVRMTVIGEGEIYEESQTIIIQTKSSIDNIPNIITPNGDRINDFFAINTTEIETFFITILDANGNTVFESKDVKFRWYGTNQGGSQLEKGRYTYMIFAKGFDGGEFKLPGQLYIE